MSFTPIDPQTIDAFATRWGLLASTVAWKGLVLLALAVLLHAVLRRGPAAARHLVWTAALVGLLLLPLLGAALPSWDLAGLPVPRFAVGMEHPRTTAEDASALRAPTELRRVTWIDDARGRTATDPRSYYVVPSSLIGAPGSVSSDEPAIEPTPTASTVLARVMQDARAWSVWTWALLTWELGVLLVVAWLALGWWHLRALQRRCRPLDDRTWQAIAHEVARELGLRRVPLLVRTEGAITPLTWGVLRPTVLLPASADRWSPAQRIDVLRHEFAHVQRRDVLTQFLAQICCALVWFHPLPWIAAARMRLERERACDDRVLLAGSRASSYAGHLLEMARSLRSEHSLAAATIGMARRSQLGERMDSLLDETPRARRLGRIARLGLVVVMGALVLPLAAARPAHTQAAPDEPETPRAVVAPRAVAPTPRTPAVPRTPRVAVIAPSADGSFHFGHGLAWAGDLDELSSSYEIDTRHSNYTMRDDETSLAVEMDGRIRFAADESDVEWMEKGAYFELETKVDRERRRMEIEAAKDGELERAYFVGGKRTDIDDDARAWFATSLAEFLVSAGVATRPRVERWVEEHGVDGAIERIDAMDNNHAAALHWSALVHLDRLSSEERAKVLEHFPSHIDSDFERVQALHAIPRAMLEDERAQAAYLAALGDVDSDFERSRALAHLLQERVHRSNAPRVMHLVDDMDSDFEKARTLVQALPLALDDAEARRTMWQSIIAMDSDFEKARVIHALVDKIEHDETMLLEALEATDTLDSDFEKSRVLRSLAGGASRFDSTRDKYVTIAEQLDGDHEYGQAMRALQRAER